VLQFTYLSLLLLCFCVAEDDVTLTAAGHGHESQTSEMPLMSINENSANWQIHFVFHIVNTFVTAVLVVLGVCM